MKNQIIVISYLLLFTFCLSYSLNSQPTYSEHKEEIIIRDLITAVNSKSSNSISTFVQRHIPEKSGSTMTEARLEKFKEITGGITYVEKYHPEKPNENESSYVVKGNNYRLLRTVYIVYRNASRNEIHEFDFGLFRKSKNTLSESAVIDSVRQLIDEISDKDLFSGSVLIAKGDEVLMKKAVGQASKRFQVMNNDSTRYNLGSMNKMFTALAIMKLVSEQVIALDDTINQFIDDRWLPGPISSQITIRHLISHSSGLGSYFTPEFFNSSRDKLRQLEDYRFLVQNEKLAFTPGSKYQYSNTGMLLLGIILEKTTGNDYYEYIRENIYKPANMKHSDSYQIDQPVENLAIGYSRAENKYGYENNILKHVLMGSPAGGGYSTVGDLHNFALALKNGKLVPEKYLQEMWIDYFGTHNYGYGFKVEDYPFEKIVGHSGGFYGISADLSIFLQSGYVAVVLSNYESGEQLSHKINHLLLHVDRPASRLND